MYCNAKVQKKCHSTKFSILFCRCGAVDSQRPEILLTAFNSIQMPNIFLIEKKFVPLHSQKE